MMLLYHVWVSPARKYSFNDKPRVTIWIEIRSHTSLSTHGTSPAGVVVWPVHASLILRSKEYNLWFNYARRCCRAWNAVLMARAILGCSPNVPLIALIDALEASNEKGLAKLLRDSFEFPLTLTTPKDPQGAVPLKCPSRIVPHVRAIGV